MPTLTVCVIQNGRTPLLLLQLLLLILPADETTVYTVCNLYFYLLSLLFPQFPLLLVVVYHNLEEFKEKPGRYFPPYLVDFLNYELS